MGRWPTYEAHPGGFGPAEKRLAMPLRVESWLTKDELEAAMYPYATIYIIPPDFMADPDMNVAGPSGRGAQVMWMVKAASSGRIEAVERLSYVSKVDPSRTVEKRPTVPERMRERVLSVGFCNYCGATENLEVDHIKPLSRGGLNLPDNLQCLCKSCNCAKKDRWPLTEDDIAEIASR